MKKYWFILFIGTMFTTMLILGYMFNDQTGMAAGFFGILGLCTGIVEILEIKRKNFDGS